MPLIAAPIDVPAPPPGEEEPVPLPDVGMATATYTDPTGTVWPLTTPDAGWFTVADGVSGLGAAQYALTTDPQPRGGARLRHAQAQPRTIVWPINVYGSTHMEFLTRWRQLATAFTRTLRDGPGFLEIARPDNSRRQIKVVYDSGWEGRTDNDGGLVDDDAVVSLWCEDPYWIDPVPVGIHRESGFLVDYLTPFPSISSGQVLGATTVTIPGDVDVWPVWTVSGPASAVTMSRQDTGESFTLTMADTPHGTLLAGETVTISTDPPSIRSSTGENLIGGLDWPGAVLWSLPTGTTPVTFQVDGSGPGSAVDLELHPRYETA